MPSQRLKAESTEVFHRPPHCKLFKSTLEKSTQTKSFIISWGGKTHAFRYTYINRMMQILVMFGERLKGITLRFDLQNHDALKLYLLHELQITTTRIGDFGLVLVSCKSHTWNSTQH